jgi:hypothetical protein
MVRAMGDAVDRKTFDALSDELLLDQAVALARLDPDEDGEEREYWDRIHALRRHGSSSTCDRALALADGDETEQRVAADILSQLGCLEGQPFKRVALAVLARMSTTASDPDLISSIVMALGFQYDEAGIPEIVRHVDHEETFVRDAVTHALGKSFVGADGWISALHPGVEALMRLTTDDDDEVRNWATFGLAQLQVDGEAVRLCLRDRLGDPHQETLGEAIDGLVRRHDPILFAWIQQALASPDFVPYVVPAALCFGSPLSFQLLQALVGHPDYDQNTLKAALLSCDETKQAAQVETLVQLAEAFDNCAVPLRISFSCEFLPDTWHQEPQEVRYIVDDPTGRRLGTSWVSDLMEQSNDSVQAAADKYVALLDDALILAKVAERGRMTQLSSKDLEDTLRNLDL